MAENDTPEKPKEISRLLTYGSIVVPLLTAPIGIVSENVWVRGVCFGAVCLVAIGIAILHYMTKRLGNVK